jgi:hypothetical protein
MKASVFTRPQTSDSAQRQDFNRLEQDEKEYTAMWLQAQPYFEQSKEMIDEDSPYYEVVIMSLVQVYVRTNQPEKAKGD